MSSSTEVKEEEKGEISERPPGLSEIEKTFNMSEPESSTCLTFQYFSCTNVELTSFQVTRIPKEADYLILAGNISAFAYPYNQHLYEYLCQTWKRVFFVPGPQEFANGPMDLGIETCKALEEELGSESFSVLSRGNPVLFPIHRLRIVGAHLWGPGSKVYTDRRISHTLKEGVDKEEVKLVSDKQAALYQEHDCAYIEHQIRLARERNERVIVVTHGCPSYLLCAESSNDQTVYTLPAPVKEDLLKNGPDYWIYGASGDKAGAALEDSKTMFCVNDYDMATDAFKVEKSTHVIKMNTPQ